MRLCLQVWIYIEREEKLLWKGINETFNIAKNCPPINRCDKVIAASMKEYYKDKQPHMTTKLKNC